MAKWDNILDIQSEEEFFEDYVREALTTPAPSLPPAEQKIGTAMALWHETEPGIARISCSGGNSPDDRAFALFVLGQQLRGHGYRIAQYELDWDHSDTELIKTAGWGDVEAKAKRLLQSGNVQILRNGRNTIVGYVQGDHGNYQTEISRDDPDSTAITTWQCECWLPGTLVVMADGTRRAIEEIVAGDKVLTASGHVGVVKRSMTRQYEGKLYGMRIQGSTETWWATDTHKLFTPDYDPIEAQAVREGDYLYMPVPQVERPTNGFNAEYLFPDRVDQGGLLYKPNKLFGSKRVRVGSRPSSPVNSRVRPVQKTWVWTHSLMRFLGLYTAEGMTTSKGEIRLSFGPTEHGLVDEVCEALRQLGCEPHVKFARHAWCVSACHAGVASVLNELVGTGSRTKVLHPSIMGASSVALQAFISGWVEGDGYESKDGRTTLATASDNLAMQARLILARLGVASVIRVAPTNTSALVPNGGSINYIVWRTDGIDKRQIRYATPTGINQRMAEPELRDYSGAVFNIEVEADLGGHSYVIGDGIASANCPWDQFAWQRTRQWKKYEGRVCSHVLATFWGARSLPLDEDAHPSGGGPQGGPQGQPSLFNMPQSPATPTGGPPRGPAPAPQGEQMQLPFQMQGPVQMPQPQPQGPDIIPQFPMDPNLQPEVNPVSVPGQKQPTPLNPVQYPGGTFSSVQDGWVFKHDPDMIWHMGAVPPNEDFANSSMVQFKEEDVGIAEGKSEAHGSGEFRTIPKNSIGEVLGQDPTTGWVDVIVPIHDAGPMEPYHIRGWFEPEKLIPRPDVRRPGPMIRRRR